MGKPKLTVRPTETELKELHQRAELAGYNSLSAYLIDCGLSTAGVLARERQTLESLKFHVRHLSRIVEENNGRPGSETSQLAPSALFVEIVQRGHEALRLINKILGQSDTDRGTG